VIGGARQHLGVVEKKTPGRESKIDRSIHFFPLLPLDGCNMVYFLKCRLFIAAEVVAASAMALNSDDVLL
jgi:hypothetical protein